MKRMLPTIVSLAVLGMVMVDLVLSHINGVLGSAGVVALAIAALFGITRLPPEALTWGRGARGERRTASGLEPLLGRGFVVLHDRRIPGGRGNIDHVLIGPQGVFVVETKYWSGEIIVTEHHLLVGDRERNDVIRQIYDAAVATQVALSARLNDLRLTVTPILCVHGSRLPMFDREVAGVQVMTGRELRKLSDAPSLLTEVQVQELAELADSRLGPMY